MKKYIAMLLLFLSVQVYADANIIYKQEMNVKMHVIWGSTNNSIPREVEDFCNGKEIVDIKMVCSAGSITFVIMYKD